MERPLTFFLFSSLSSFLLPAAVVKPLFISQTTTMTHISKALVFLALVGTSLVLAQPQSEWGREEEEEEEEEERRRKKKEKTREAQGGAGEEKKRALSFPTSSVLTRASSLRCSVPA